MEWTHKGQQFEIEFRPMGSFVMAATSSRKEGPYVRRRPFSALGRSQEEALELLKAQIELEYRKVPAI